MSVWFVEVPRMGGGWSSQLIHGDRPSPKNSEGASKGFRTEPKELHPDEAEHLTLAELQEMYGEPDISPRYIEPQDRTGMAWDLRRLAPELYLDISQRYIERLEQQIRLTTSIIQKAFYLDRVNTPRAGLIGDSSLDGVLTADEIEMVNACLSTEVDPPEPLGEVAALGIVEIAARNPGVMEYMEHWESRAIRAERKARLTEYALQTLLYMSKDAIYVGIRPDVDVSGICPDEVVEVLRQILATSKA